MGDVIRELAAASRLEATPDNLGKLMLAIRRKEGSEAVAKRILAKVDQSNPQRTCIEGLRSLSEVDLIRAKLRNLTVIAVLAPPEVRFKRLHSRERGDDTKSLETFADRDKREIEVGLGGVLALADYFLINDGTIEELRESTTKFMSKVDLSVQTVRRS